MFEVKSSVTERAQSLIDLTNYKVRRVRVAKIVADVAILQSANAIRNVLQLLQEIFGKISRKKANKSKPTGTM